MTASAGSTSSALTGWRRRGIASAASGANRRRKRESRFKRISRMPGRAGLFLTRDLTRRFRLQSGRAECPPDAASCDIGTRSRNSRDFMSRRSLRSTARIACDRGESAGTVRRLGLRVGHDLDARAPELPPLRLLAEALALDGDGDDQLALGVTPAFAARRRAAQVALIHFDVAGELVLIAARPDHRQPQLLRQQPGGLVADPQLTLQLLRADAALAARHHPRRPEPRQKRQSRSLEDRPGAGRAAAAQTSTLSLLDGT
jgi:hypothetical protein